MNPKNNLSVLDFAADHGLKLAFACGCADRDFTSLPDQGSYLKILGKFPYAVVKFDIAKLKLTDARK